MRLRWAHIVVLLAVLAMICGCGRRSRVIPADKLVRIYHDMFLADQWLRDNQSARKVADTTLFFDPIFRRHGYTFEDYDRSVQYYLDHPEQYSKILDRAAERLRKEGDRLQKEADAIAARDFELSRYRQGYQRHEFTLDSLRWTGPQDFWAASLPPEDTLEVKTDSLSVSLDSLRLERPRKALIREGAAKMPVEAIEIMER